MARLMHRRDVKIAAAVLLITGGFVIGRWFWNDLFGQRADVRRWVYQACARRPTQFKAEGVRAIGPDSVPYLIKMLQVQDNLI